MVVGSIRKRRNVNETEIFFPLLIKHSLLFQGDILSHLQAEYEQNSRLSSTKIMPRWYFLDFEIYRKI